MGLNIPLFLTLGIPIYENEYESNTREAPKPTKKQEQSGFKAMPMNPTIGQIWVSGNGKRYIWTGEFWAPTDAPKMFYADQDKSNAKEGDMWVW